ncbi:type II toxin-antitoxin system VapC family toxin [Rhizobium sp. CSW-27]|uniref:type II toxin-antitoxin system VapC family toxin n=1 Tax=Rhizobium sp. CSW-27 TaxID=2839985 RepID=UPI001C00C612|nr:type II toxin-antitoxin system VapC family toxin [Rhizobium sp. CSW-27]MBT9368336.1 type II toxin-antitoxin system VapC family toxin [Rhizobium sp. CSW-27]
MKYLLDTHTLLWWLADSPQLSPAAIRLIEDNDNDIYVSAASAWEVTTKWVRGKLPSAVLLLPDFAAVVTEEGFLELPVTSVHMVRSCLLPGVHRDPFDRIIAAQAIQEGMGLISTDEKIAEFGIVLHW